MFEKKVPTPHSKWLSSLYANGEHSPAAQTHGNANHEPYVRCLTEILDFFQTKTLSSPFITDFAVSKNTFQMSIQK